MTQANRALHGFSQYQRQAFVGGNYGLTASINPHTQSALGSDEALLLRPDYWLNFLWKRTIGTSDPQANTVSMFCFRPSGGHDEYVWGCIAMLPLPNIMTALYG